MGLNVYLKSKEKEKCTCTCDKCGNIHECEQQEEVYFDAYVTHNLIEMAKNCGIYVAVWRPEEINIKEAYQLIIPIEDAIDELKSYPEKFQFWQPKNGFGTYIGFLKFLEKYVEVCKKYPNAIIEVSR
jgi:hypothetical protein